MSLMWMLHGNYSVEISDEAAIKMSPSCLEWQTLCWLTLRAYAIYKYYALNKREILWIAVAVLTLTIIISLMLKFKVMIGLTTIEPKLEEATDLIASESSEGNAVNPVLSSSSISEVSLINHRNPGNDAGKASKKLREYIEAKRKASELNKTKEIPIWRI